MQGIVTQWKSQRKSTNQIRVNVLHKYGLYKYTVTKIIKCKLTSYCIKSGLIRDLIGYSMHEKQDNNVKELIKYLCTE